MANKEETRARLEALKRDQETLKKELASLDTFMETKARSRSGLIPARRDYHEPSKRYGRVRSYDESPRERYERRSYYPTREYDYDTELYDLMQQNLDETHKMMDKFDYLLDTLIQSMEEVEGENIDDLIKALAESQMHVMDVLATIKVGIDQAKADAATKKELEELQRTQSNQYQELNKKINIVMDQAQSPPYLKELDNIRVSVANLESQLRRIEKEGIKAGGGVAPELDAAIEKMKTQTLALEERLGNLSASIESISDHMNRVQATIASLASMKTEMEKMRDMLSAKDDQLLNEMQMRINKLEERMVELNNALAKMRDIEETFKALPNDQIAHLVEEMQVLKKVAHTENIQSLHKKIDAINASLAEEIKKKREEETNRKILDRLVKKAGQLEENIDKLDHRITSSEAASTFSDIALQRKLDELERAVANNNNSEFIKHELSELKQRITSSEAASAFSDIALDKKLEEMRKRLVSNGDVEQLRKELNELTDYLASIEAASAYGDTALQQELVKLGKRVMQSETSSASGDKALREKIEEIRESLKHDEASYRKQLENKVNALAKLVAMANHYDEIKSLESELSNARDEINKLRRQVKRVEVIETYSRLRDKQDAIEKTKELSAKLDRAWRELSDKAAAIEESLSKSEAASAQSDRKALDMLESLRQELEDVKAYASNLDEELKKNETELEEIAENKELKELLAQQKKRLAEIESSFDMRTNTLERELSNMKDFLEERRKEREKRIMAQLDQLKKEIIQARRESNEILPDLDKRISRLYAEMERLKKETPEELKALAAQINTVNRTMDEVQRELRYGEVQEEKIASLSEEVGRLYAMISALTEEAGKSRAMFTKIETLEKALERARGMKGGELESALGVIRNELSALEDEVKDVKESNENLSKEIENVHSNIRRLEKKTRDEIYAKLNDVKKQSATTKDVNELRKSLAELEKRLEKEKEMENLRDHVILARRAADKGDISEARAVLEAMPVPKHPVVKNLSPESLEKLEKELKHADDDYSVFTDKVKSLREQYEKEGLSQELKEELMYLEEDLLDFWIDKRGLTEALEQARNGNIEAAEQILEYERSVLEDLKLDINSLRMKAAKLPKKAVHAIETAIDRREAAEKELAAYSELADSLEKMKKEREKLRKELEAAKVKSMKAIVPEKVQESLEVAMKRPTPEVSQHVEKLEQDLQEKQVVPITQNNLEKARAKIGELAGKARQIEYGTRDPRAVVARERLEKSRDSLKAVYDDSESLKELALREELERVKGEKISLNDLSTRTGLPISDIEVLLPRLGDYTISNGFVLAT